jgi:hypothetical protein
LEFDTRSPQGKEIPTNSEYTRKIITVRTNAYEGEEGFSKNSKVFLKIKPTFSTFTQDANEQVIP